MKDEQRRISLAADLLPLALVVSALYLARPVLVPVALAALLTFLLTPLAARLQRLVRSRGLAVALVTLTSAVVVAATTYVVGHQFISLVARLPEYRETIAAKVRTVRQNTQDVVSDATRTLRNLGSELTTPPRQDADPAAPAAPASPETALAAAPADPLATVAAVIRPLLSPLASALVVALLLAMMLYSRESIRDRVIRLAGLRQISLTTQSLEDTGARVGRYLRALSIINLIYGAVVYLGLSLLGLPDALLYGVIAGVLRFIPIFGVWFGAALPALVAIAVFDGWSHLVMVVSLFAVVELIATFVLEPWLYGTSTGISSMGVVLAIVFWTWIWGPVGLVLAMPITVCIVVFARQIPRLAVVPILFGDEPALSESARFFQRVLVNNEDDAAAILRATPPPADGQALPAVAAARLDAIVVPAFGTVREEVSRAAISEPHAVDSARRIRDVTLDWLGELLADSSPGTPVPRAPVYCIPVNDEIDEHAGAVLASCAEPRGLQVTVGSARPFLSESLRDAQAAGASVIVLSVVAPASQIHTRRVAKAVRRALPEARILVCAWNDPDPPTPHPEPIIDARATTLTEAVETLVRLTPLPPAPPA